MLLLKSLAEVGVQQECHTSEGKDREKGDPTGKHKRNHSCFISLFQLEINSATSVGGIQLYGTF